MVNHGQEKPGVEKERDTATDADTENALDVPDEVAEEDQAHAHTSYIADEEQESQPHVVHVSQDNLFSADLKSTLCHRATHSCAALPVQAYLADLPISATALSLYPVFWKGGQLALLEAISHMME